MTIPVRLQRRSGLVNRLLLREVLAAVEGAVVYARGLEYSK